MTRRWELDALRGLMLVLMTLTHLPTRLSSPLGQPLGFVSAAEGFVLLSAYMAGLVYGRVARKKGIEAMRAAFWRRALKVYACHAAMLLFLFTVVAAAGLWMKQSAVTDLMSFYLAQPLTALAMGLVLVYTPPLLDILPMYIVFMLVSPWLLAHALRHGWRAILAASLIAWLLAQFRLGRWVYDAAVALTGLRVPFEETGSFATFSWQLVWIAGLWMGASRTADPARPFTFARWTVALAVLVALAGLVWRHHEGQAPFGADESLNLLFDKWLLGPLRLLDLAALIIVTIRFGPWLKAAIPRPRRLEALGAASLPVFCAHLVVVLLALAFLGAVPEAHAWWVDAALLIGCFSALYAVAKVALTLKRPHGLRPGFAASVAAAPQGATQSPTATAGSPPR
ncbi:MAG: OpgC domain-containing protein [Pseudomonadota bacterium]|nr:OpgC domain-containing protein [Pseudomonadota bacterium]